VERIAVINVGGIGDEVLFSPVLAALGQAYPAAHITLFLEHRSRSIAPLLPHVAHTEALPQVTDRKALFATLLSRLRKGRFNAVVSSGSSPFIAMLLWLTGIPIRVGYATGKPTDKLLTHAAPLNQAQYAGAMYAALAERWLGHACPHTPVVLPMLAQVTPALTAWLPPKPPHARRLVLHPGVSLMSVAKRILKNWPTEQWSQLTNALLQQGHQLIMAGGPDDTETLAALQQQLPPHPNLHWGHGQTHNLHDLCWLLQQADALICADSAPMHLAVAVDTPVIALFAGTNPTTLLPQGNPKWVPATVQGLACRPCLFTVRKTSCENPVCLDIPLNTVLTAVTQVLAAPTAGGVPPLQ
jgi:ADP-heptose:LPS heptosyltransferase